MAVRHQDADRESEPSQHGSRRAVTNTGSPAGRLLDIQRSAGNRAAVSLLGQRTTDLPVQRDDESDPTQDFDPGMGQDSAEELQAKPTARTKEEARTMVDAHVEPKPCFIEKESTKAGWRAIPGTGCAHWVAHQRGGPKGTANVCDVGFKYRVKDLLASLYQASSDLSAAQPGFVWSASGSSHVGIVRSVVKDPVSSVVTSVEVENDSSASGGVVRQFKTDGSIYE